MEIREVSTRPRGEMVRLRSSDAWTTDATVWEKSGAMSNGCMSSLSGKKWWETLHARSQAEGRGIGQQAATSRKIINSIHTTRDETHCQLSEICIVDGPARRLPILLIYLQVSNRLYSYPDSAGRAATSARTAAGTSASSSSRRRSTTRRPRSSWCRRRRGTRGRRTRCS